MRLLWVQAAVVAPMVAAVAAVVQANQSLGSRSQRAKISQQQSALVASALCLQVAHQQLEQARLLHAEAPHSSQQMAGLPAQRVPVRRLALVVPQHWDLQVVPAVPDLPLWVLAVQEKLEHRISSSEPKRNMAVVAVAVRTTTELTPMQSHLAQAVAVMDAVLQQRLPTQSACQEYAAAVVVQDAQATEVAPMQEMAATALC